MAQTVRACPQATSLQTSQFVLRGRLPVVKLPTSYKTRCSLLDDTTIVQKRFNAQFLPLPHILFLVLLSVLIIGTGVLDRLLR